MEKTPARFIWHYVKIFKWSFLLIGFLVVVRQITEAISPWYLAKIYETVSAAPEGGMPWQQLYVYAFRLAAVMLGGNAGGGIRHVHHCPFYAENAHHGDQRHV